MVSNSYSLREQIISIIVVIFYLFEHDLRFLLLRTGTLTMHLLSSSLVKQSLQRIIRKLKLKSPFICTKTTSFSSRGGKIARLQSLVRKLLPWTSIVHGLVFWFLINSNNCSTIKVQKHGIQCKVAGLAARHIIGHEWKDCRW